MALSIASRSVPEQIFSHHGLPSRPTTGNSSEPTRKMSPCFSPSFSLTPLQKSQYEEQGYLVLTNVFTPSEISSLKSWSQEVHDLPRTQDCPYLQYDEINAAGKKVLCRTENFCSSHERFSGLLRGERLCGILRGVSGEEMCLFKEKINYKFSGSGGFKPHIDRSGYGNFKNLSHISILISVDASTVENGCLEVVEGSHRMEIPICQDEERKNTIDPCWVERQVWKPVVLKVGEVLIFGTSLAHRSAANRSKESRRAVYATYNPRKDGDKHDAYYKLRAEKWPSTHKRVSGRDYSEGKQNYAYGTPMLSIDFGKRE